MKEKIQLLLSKKIVLFGGILILICIALISLLLLQTAKPKNPPKAAVSVSPPAVSYYQRGFTLLVEREKYRLPLIPNDEAVREMLVKRHNPLSKTVDYNITYDPLKKLFQAQITTVNIDIAKHEVVDWFTNQGMTNEALCRLPVSFTLKPSVANSLKGLNIVFNPIAPGCV